MHLYPMVSVVWDWYMLFPVFCISRLVALFERQIFYIKHINEHVPTTWFIQIPSIFSKIILTINSESSKRRRMQDCLWHLFFSVALKQCILGHRFCCVQTLHLTPNVETSDIYIERHYAWTKLYFLKCQQCFFFSTEICSQHWNAVGTNNYNVDNLYSISVSLYRSVSKAYPQ